MKQDIIAVAGPTASGKSALALALCEKYGGELVSFDSMQIYKGLDIGTAKPTADEQKRVKHHMTDICAPDENYSVADFAKKAKAEISAVLSNGSVAVLCGGTGLYLDSVLKNTDFGEVTSDEEYRSYLFSIAEKEGATFLHAMLEKSDPESAAAIHENNVRRVVRALEIQKVTGYPKSEWDRKASSAAPPIPAVIIGLDYMNRDTLYNRIDRRVDAMFRAGLEDEVRHLLSLGYLGADTTAGQAIGYKETAEYVRGEITLEQAIEKIKTGTRRYAKRQLTWFRRNKNINWLYPDSYPDTEALFNAASDIIG